MSTLACRAASARASRIVAGKVCEHVSTMLRQRIANTDH
jgi:hypothetical protein